VIRAASVSAFVERTTIGLLTFSLLSLSTMFWIESGRFYGGQVS